MPTDPRATRIALTDFHSPPMRAFHVTWAAFFLCFFAWFGIAPLMPIIREEFGLTKAQVGQTLIASVAITILARLFIGWFCDRVGPRLAYTWLLVLGSLPVMGIGLANDFETFLIFRLLIGAIGASFVITQYHTSLMFAPNCIGTANATTAGWGNLGGGVTQLAMPLIFSMFVTLFGFTSATGWRLSMVVAGAICLLAGVGYYFLTQDTPEGNLRELRAAGRWPESKRTSGMFLVAIKDYRTWLLALLYGACFGMELTIKNIAALYFTDYFGLGLQAAGFAAAAYGLMNLFARTLGGYVSDRCAATWGLNGRTRWLCLALVGEGIALVAFSQAPGVAAAVSLLIVVGLFVQMANGATYSVVPFVNRQALGSVSGIVGAGGNVGAVAFGFLFQGELAWTTALLICGILVATSAAAALAIRFATVTAPQPATVLPETASPIAANAPQPATTREIELEPAST